MSAIALIDKGPLDLASGQLLRFLDHVGQRVSIMGIAR